MHCRFAAMMDGHYVPNLALTPDHLTALRPYTRLPFEIHLELDNPDEVMDQFRPIGADLIIVCWNTLNKPHKTLTLIRAQGAKAGISFNPDEALGETDDLLPELDVLLILGVFPGFGGQGIRPDTARRVARAREAIRTKNVFCIITVDGTVNLKNAPDLVKAGADVLVIGNALFNAPRMDEFLAQFREVVHENNVSD